MSIYFQKIRWKNFLSTGNIFTEVNLNTTGTTLIVGSNGSGKSTLLCALTYALFGKPFRNINRPQLLNTITKKDLVVELEFSIGKNNYLIRRGMTPKLFEVHCNDNLLNQSADVRDYQEILEKQILKLNYKTFCQVDILGSASFVPFMQLPLAQRRTVIEDLLDLQIFSTMNVLLKENIQQNNTDLLENEYKKKLIDEKIRIIKEHITDLKKKSTIFINEKKNNIQDLNKKNIEHNNTLQQVVLNEKQKIEQLSNINIKGINNKINQYIQIKSDLNATRNILNSEIDFFSNHENCPTCKQGISSDLSCEKIGKNETKRQEIDNALNKIQKTEESYLEQITHYNLLSTELNIIQKEKEQIKSIISQLNWKIDSLNEEIKSASSENDTISVNKIEEYESELTECMHIYNDLKEQKQILSIAATLLKDGGIKTKIINQYIPIINKLINKYLSVMDFFVDFQLNSQFEETIKSRFRDEFSYASFSEGEKQRIDLALLFTWRAIAKLRNSMHTNLLILDEVMDSSLDTNSTEMLMQILNTIGTECSLFVISHKEHLNEKFSNIIKFVKHKNFSHIE